MSYLLKLIFLSQSSKFISCSFSKISISFNNVILYQFLVFFFFFFNWNTQWFYLLSLKIMFLKTIDHSSRKLLRIKVTPDLHLTYSKNGGNLGLVLKMKNIACLSILLTKHVKYTYLYLFKFVLYSIIAFKVN